ncbi:PucR family transcriptional regulator [Streptomyces sp. A7024]|uniref:PucR family transcriptional regulator n=1 Tax=Streptomyces coryli TaxID=1128680 RepID=A0A6G4TX41_9ACTN|nr:PucR family transcriptional regulator [Streptomyces coryli]
MSVKELPVREAFARMPPDVAETLRPYLPLISEDVVAEIQHEVPEYARPDDATYMANLRTGVEQALSLFLDRIGRPAAGAAEVTETYEAIGRGEAYEGRTLDAFQSALRLGARVAVRRFNEVADISALPDYAPAVLVEAVFVHLDQIAAAATAGYAEAQLHAAGELQRRRDRLVEMVTSQPPAPEEAVVDLAHAARWPVPATLAVIVVDRPPEGPAPRPLLPPEFLTRFDAWPGRIVVPDPEGPGRARDIEQALRGHRAALGPTVPLTDGGRSLRWATAALGLARRGILPDEKVVRCADHLSVLLLFQDESMADALGDELLAPLRQIRSPHRERLAETLLCWLQCGRNASEVAAVLGIHPQTARYRLRQLDELFGALLQDADARFELELVLRVRQLRLPAA